MVDVAFLQEVDEPYIAPISQLTKESEHHITPIKRIFLGEREGSEACMTECTEEDSHSSHEEEEQAEDEEEQVQPLEPLPVELHNTSMMPIRKSVSTFSLKSALKYSGEEIPIQEKRSSWKALPKPDLDRIRSQSVPTTRKEHLQQQRQSVGFAHVHIRSFDQTVGDNPCVSYGPPISLDWTFEDMESISLDTYEELRGTRRTPRQMLLNYYMRKNLLTWRFGITEEELKVAEKKANKIKRERAVTRALLPVGILQEAVQSAARKTKRLGQRQRENTI